MSEAFNMHRYEIYSSHAGSKDRFTLIEQSYYTVNSYFRIYGVMKQSLLCMDFTDSKIIFCINVNCSFPKKLPFKPNVESITDKNE